MNEPKFTRGPWVFCKDDKRMYQATDDGKRIKLLFSFDMSYVGLSASEHNANVALMEASPLMYALLVNYSRSLSKSLRYRIKRYMLNGCSREQAIDLLGKMIEEAKKLKRVLKKARGEI